MWAPQRRVSSLSLHAKNLVMIMHCAPGFNLMLIFTLQSFSFCHACMKKRRREEKKRGKKLFFSKVNIFLSRSPIFRTLLKILRGSESEKCWISSLKEILSECANWTRCSLSALRCYILYILYILYNPSFSFIFLLAGWFTKMILTLFLLPVP